MDTPAKKNFLHSLDLKRSRGLFGIGTGPESDWKIILVSSLAVALAVIGLSVFIFIEIERGSIFEVEGTPDDVSRTLDVAKLRETVSYYEYKATQFERIKSSRITAVDPSL